MSTGAFQHDQVHGRDGVDGAQQQRRSHRIAELNSNDMQFRRAQPDTDLVEVVQDSNMRLATTLSTLVRGYADRAALGQRVHDPRMPSGLLPGFITMSYRTMWARVSAIASVWGQHALYRVVPGAKVAAIGFASPEYLMVDLVCAYLGLVSAPISHSATTSEMRAMLSELEPEVLAVGAQYLDAVIDIARDIRSIRRLLVFDYQPDRDDHRERLMTARAKYRRAVNHPVIETFQESAEHGRSLAEMPLYTEGSDDRLALILYTSGSTGTPKGVMYTERMLKKLWTAKWALSDAPVFNLNFMPLNHVTGRVPVISAFLAGGTSYFVGNSDLSTLFEDWNLVRPTQLPLVPRVVDMLFDHYRRSIDRRVSKGANAATAEAEARTELRDQIFGGRVLGGFTAAAPLTTEMKDFLDSAFDVHFSNMLGSTEAGLITRDNQVMRPPVIDYKLVDVPELGYFATDKPFPGENSS